MKRIKYPIDTKSDQFTYGYWLGRMIGLIDASLLTSPDQLEAAKYIFSGGFESLFPERDLNLNSITIESLIINLDKQEGEHIWRPYSRLLSLWMDLQEETLPGIQESQKVRKQEFINVIRLAKHQLEQLPVTFLSKFNCICKG